MNKGDKLIFIRPSGGLTGKIGDVVTFSNWYDRDAAVRAKNSFYEMFPDRLTELDEGGREYQSYFQCQELLDCGNIVHNMPTRHTESFNPDNHRTFRILTVEIIKKEEQDFINKYGE